MSSSGLGLKTGHFQVGAKNVFFSTVRSCHSGIAFLFLDSSGNSLWAAFGQWRHLQESCMTLYMHEVWKTCWLWPSSRICGQLWKFIPFSKSLKSHRTPLRISDHANNFSSVLMLTRRMCLFKVNSVNAARSPRELARHSCSARVLTEMGWRVRHVYLRACSPSPVLGSEH